MVNQMKKHWEIWVLGLLYFVGTASMLFPELKTLILPFAALNLALSFGLLLHTYRWDGKILILSFMLFAVGMTAEWIGVHTGYLFGDYVYGANLGPKLFEVPLIIGVNWAMLAWLAFDLAKRLAKNKAAQVFIGAATMTLIDVLMEPVAAANDFWAFKNLEVPLFNYLCWFLLSIFIQLYLVWQVKLEKNKTALWLLGFICFYFLIQIL